VGGAATGIDTALLEVLQQQRLILSALQGIASGRAAQSPPAGSGSVVQAIRTPDEMLQVLLAALKRGQIDRWYARQTMPVPAGTTQEMVMGLPGPDLVGLVVGQHVMQVSPSLASVLVTHVDDRNPIPLIEDAPANGPIGLLGAFIRPVAVEIKHIVQGDPNEDVLFTMQLQGVLMKRAYWSKTFQPMLQAWYEGIASAYGALA